MLSVAFMYLATCGSETFIPWTAATVTTIIINKTGIDCTRGYYDHTWRSSQDVAPLSNPPPPPSQSPGLTFTWWGWDVTVFVPDINQPSSPTPFTLFLCLFLSVWPCQLYFIQYILPTTLRILTLFFWSCSALLILWNIYISLYESLHQPWYNPLWLIALKAHTN